MIEIKLSQGAKPGRGGVLPAAKINEEISRARRVPMGCDGASPACHRVFSTPIELTRFVKLLRELAESKPVWIMLCLGHPWEFMSLVKAILVASIAPDFIAVDGTEGGAQGLRHWSSPIMLGCRCRLVFGSYTTHLSVRACGTGSGLASAEKSFPVSIWPA